MSSPRFLAPLLAAAAVVVMPALAQKVYTAQDYTRAERWMSYNVNGLVHHTISRPQYLSDGRVFYRDPGADGTAYMIADPAKTTTAPAFDSAKLAAALTAASGRQVEAKRLGVSAYYPESNGGFAIIARSGTFHCAAAASKCTEDKAAMQEAPRGRRRAGETNLSPDGKLGAFIRDNNLWVRDIATGKERPLTTDGVKDFGYATDNAGWTHSDSAVVTWSPDSKKIATFQMDERKTGMMYLVPVTNRHPHLEAWHYPLVGDKDVTMIQPVILDVDSAKMVRLKIAPLEHRSMECDDVSCNGDGHWTDVEFSPDGSHLAFVSTSRDHKDEWVKVADTATGDVRDVYHEHVPTYYGWQSKTDWKYLPASDEFLWVSERSNYAQIYLYDLKTGKLKNQITHGDGPISDILNVDEKHRVVYFTAVGREKGDDLYFENYYRVDFDGKNEQLLTPEHANHVITPSDDGSSFVDVYSTIDTPQTAVLRDNTGKVLVTLAHQDISQLLATGWKPPTPFTVKARDGVTPLEGIMWKPTNFDPNVKYPIVDNVYPGPQGSLCELSGRSFAAAKGDEQALADLGFVVVCIDGMGNPGRSKEFHDAHSSTPQEMGDDTIPDQVAGIKDLAARYSWIDVNRVGIWGHSGGGNATASAMFHFPDFFKVGWSESGNHDNRDYEDDWDERWAGLEHIDPNGEDNYEAQANQGYVKDLKGHLMLVHGTMDDNVPPSNTLLVVEALMKANKNFDMIMVPNVHHGYGAMAPYIMRRRWDYFVKYLAGGVPPTDFKMATPEEVQRKMAASGPDDEDDE
ncbi:prolyl oligopeptidase family serine peptidase [Granulicella sp. 5B5]|uniref:S9 family peptidase n=1 Tax=Granulicella sp. 5B5 TaxID=1617967 RepID=UPI0015F4BBD2|nr:DPP IV N-terminal domain-containing protein [Granulicella sp. 5B5]QMV18696.1 prolyl oligopeptidase family serine peptidase [Granulicella sp. 5B5]